MKSGGLSVMTSGVQQMLRLYADSLVSTPLVRKINRELDGVGNEDREGGCGEGGWIEDSH